MERFFPTCAALALCALGAGCATTTPPEPAPAPTVRSTDGAHLTLEQLTDLAIAADVVIIGEEHDNTAAQALAADLWHRVLARAPTPALSPALCLEFFERDEQLVIDDYLRGVIESEDAFTREAGRSEGNYPEGHRRMLEAAKAAGRPVIAANVPRRYASYARARDFDALRALSAERRAMFTIPGPPALESYRQRFGEVMTPMLEQHGGADPGAIDGLYRSQILKDATMADGVADTVLAGHRPVLLVVGRFHTDHDGGTLVYLRRMLPQADILTISVTREPEPEPPADIVIVAP